MGCLHTQAMSSRNVYRCFDTVPSRSIGAARHLYHLHWLLLWAQLGLSQRTYRRTLVRRLVRGRAVEGVARLIQHGWSGVATSGLPSAP